MHYYVYNRPEDKLHHETPARFTWFPVEGAQGYAVVVYDAQGAEAFRYEGIDINFFTPPDVMAPGAYRYSVYADGQEIISRQPFAIAEDAVQTPLPPREGRYAAIGGHPRIWLGEEGIARLAEQHTGELRAEWGRFLQTGVVPWVDTPVHKEPDFYPGNKRVIPLWRAM